MNSPTQPAMARADLIESVATLWARGLAEQDARAPEAAAKAAGISDPEHVAAWIAAHRPAEQTADEETAA